MGYYSTMHLFTFKSLLSEKKLKRAFKRFVSNLDETPDTKSFMEIYSFDLLSEKDGAYEYDLAMDDYHDKHYASEHLAEFVSQVIAQGIHTVITEDGEDGERSGRLVLRGKVRVIDYTPLVDGMLIDEYLKSIVEEEL